LQCGDFLLASAGCLLFAVFGGLTFILYYLFGLSTGDSACVEAGLMVLAAWVAALIWYWFPGGSFIIGMGSFSMPPLSRIFDIPVSIFV
jgi:hypothetical protein